LKEKKEQKEIIIMPSNNNNRHRRRLLLQQRRTTQVGCYVIIVSAALIINKNTVTGFSPLTPFRLQNSPQQLIFVNNNNNNIANDKTLKFNGHQQRVRHRQRLDTNSKHSNKNNNNNNNKLMLLLLSSTCATPHNDDPMNNRHSASDWFYNIKSLPQSKVLREIRNPVIAVAAWSLFVSIIHTVGTSTVLAQIWTIPTILQYIAKKMCISGTAHSFLVSALGLLLVFRTNSAYQRFNVRTHIPNVFLYF
jgi:Bestrophin, RFP-TM, chloride channel